MGEVGDRAVALLRLAQARLGADALSPRDEQGPDQECLADEEGQGAQDRPPVLRPQRLLAEQYHAARGQPRLVDSPALELPPVELERLGGWTTGSMDEALSPRGSGTSGEPALSPIGA